MPATRERQPMTCPACGGTMERVPLEGTIRGPFDVDLCRACRSFWFDSGEQFRLTPRSTLQLLRALADGPETPRARTGTRRACPICASALGRTYDLAGTDQLQFFRCPSKHGIFIAVADFLRSQGLIRGLSAHELEALRGKLTTVTCSSCGAPVPLERGRACEHCGASVAVIDREHLTAALRQLEADAATVPAVKPPAPRDAVVERWRADREARAEEEPETTWVLGRRRRTEVDLLDVGLTLLRGVLGRW